MRVRIAVHRTVGEARLLAGVLEAAGQLIAELEENREAASKEVTCPRCHEVNPGNFELCWSCGLEFPSTLRPRLRAVP